MFSLQVARIMTSNLTNCPEMLSAMGKALAPDSTVTSRQVESVIAKKKCYHAIAEKDSRKVETFLVL